MSGQRARRTLFGAEVMTEGVSFRVWAPDHRRVRLVVEGRHDSEMEREEGGAFSLLVPDLRPGDRYRFRLGRDLHPDPASRFQPEGPDGPSEVIDPAFPWTDDAWPGLALAGQVLMEVHVGTLTEEGSWEAAARELPRLRDMGVTAVELMPVADFTGRFGWGYDGVSPFAPTRLYGRPESLRAFVDRAHALGIGVILDVVYNHLGAEANHLTAYARAFLSREHGTDWGQELNMDGESSETVRAFVLANVRHWIAEYHLDGLRIDATQNITDDGPVHILAEIVREARASAGRRSILVIGENEPQDARLLKPLEQGGFGMDAVWADDLHHSAHVALTGRGGAYQSDYLGTPQELIQAFRRPYLFQGQAYSWQEDGRGTPSLDLAPARFVACLENHDQLANIAAGQRMRGRTSPGRMRAMTGLLLLGPTTPMLFQGQETGTDRPFTYFSDPSEALRDAVRQGRLDTGDQFGNLADPAMRDHLPDPTSEANFRACKLGPPASLAEEVARRRATELHRDLLRLRREDPTIRLQGSRGVEGAVLAHEALLLRFFGPTGPGGAGDRLLLLNLGPDLRRRSLAEPLLAPPPEGPWRLLWSSEHPNYGGLGTAPVFGEDLSLFIQGHSAVLLGA